MATERQPARQQPRSDPDPCRCALCLALLEAVRNAVTNQARLSAERRATMRIMDGGRR
ncbi:MAG: hypothetical protein KF809_14910 [Chloroflexi bacterium]|nr:hypothetical protein [Chloroflexota bacterium]